MKTAKTSKDQKTTKILFRRKSKEDLLEGVLMKHKDGRNTICVSCMVGCPVNCVFCATGQLKFGGNLNTREIIDQILHFKRQLKKEDEKITNIVFMGMGEPLLNLDNVLEAIDIITDPEKLAMSKRRLTISTSGYIPQLKRLTKEGFIGKLAISLHAPNQKLRKKLMPTVAKTNPLDKLMRALDQYTKKTNKQITYEYVLIDKINDQKKHADELSELLKNRLAHVNLIPYNPIGKKAFRRSSDKNIKKFEKILSDNNISFTRRVTMGEDIDAACGQLARK